MTTMKQPFSLAFLFLSFYSFGQTLSVNVSIASPAVAAGNDTVYYNPDHKLSWNNFAGPYEISGNVAALTASGFGFKANMQSSNGRGRINISTFCFFSRSGSWVKPNKKTDYILGHEQHHFDISYIGMRVFIDRLQRAHFTLQNYATLLNKIYEESYRYMSELQQQYDGETKNGQLAGKQVEWDNSIDYRLALLPDRKGQLDTVKE